MQPDIGNNEQGQLPTHVKQGEYKESRRYKACEGDIIEGKRIATNRIK